MSKGNFYFPEMEMTHGIVFPQDFVNNKSRKSLKKTVEIGNGIFALSPKKKLNSLNLDSSKKKLIKPCYTTDELIRYYANSKNKLWIIYTGSEFKNPKLMQPYPNLKMHLDRFKDIITSDNKPYGLHRIREERFFKGESITAQRKCPYRPSFSYTDFDCYVSATFYVIEKIKNNSHYYNVKFNSKTGGLMATHVDHIFDPKKKGGVKLKYKRLVINTGDPLSLNQKKEIRLV